MELPPLIPGHFVRRDNRFRVTVEIEGKPVAAYLPNSGRLRELLTPGRPCFLRRYVGPTTRKTGFDLLLVEHGGVLVSVDSHLPNPLFAEAVAAGTLRPFHDAISRQREVRLGASRIDFRLSWDDGSSCWVEVKSVTLVEDGRARFPDAPTVRGSRHVAELMAAVRRGERAAVVFIVQRPDAWEFAPNDRADERFGDTLREAARSGVEVYAWRCSVSRREVTIAAEIPVVLA